jgi:hypothetical protein
VTVALDSWFHVGAVPSRAATSIIVVAMAILLFAAGLALAIGSSKITDEPNVHYPRMVAR